MESTATLSVIRAFAEPAPIDDPHAHDSLIAAIGDSRVVLLGEASHGTHEFYDTRARITKRLIEEKGFTAVAVEADWPDAYRINRYVRHASQDSGPHMALQDFSRFPTWMWRNTDVLDFVEWLHSHNGRILPGKAPVGFYGLDLYSMHASMNAVLSYLDERDPEAAKRARHRYSCFDHFGDDPQAYGYAASFDLSSSCEQAVLAQLLELQKTAETQHDNGRGANDELFFARQNARLVLNAEQYYRSMFRGRTESWNNRDRHMAQTLEALIAHQTQELADAKIVVWAHNSHIGDARATEMGTGGELNLGQLVRERHGDNAFLIGFTTYHGTVLAASEWDAPAKRKRVRDAWAGSVEALFHQLAIPRFVLRLRGNAALREALRASRLERAIGVIYRPDTERLSHYFEVKLAEQFDAVIHIDDTDAVKPLNHGAAPGPGPDLAETYPSGM